jgi:signal transduction histidine kinase
MRIADDGSGFNPAQQHGGLGLQIMRERVQAHGGRLDLKSAPAQGTVLMLYIPYGGGK